ncbi:Pentatricopeptide repeat-containing protein [Zea mays]|uniref:Pentatricopeptide repeat-containing protein n=1 Tax=Zea mays TaxID=4577 RepID=A0A3L6E5B5_MAIZE|nr:Pentatricopeptide repeat-containing protein [Zea mays]
MMTRCGVQLLVARGISSSPRLSQRINQMESEIVRMFHPPIRQSEEAIATIVPRYTYSMRVLDERFIRILKIFKWGPDAEKALEVLMLRVDHWLVREVMKTDVGVNVKMQFFRWATKRRNYEHDTSTYMALIHCLEVVEQYGEMWKMIQEMVRDPICVVTPTELSDVVRKLGNAKMVSKAIAISYHIKTRKCQPTAQAYNSMIIMLMHEGQYEKVHQLYNEMSTEGHCFPDTMTYSALIFAFCKLGRRDSAIQLLNEMKEIDSNCNCNFDLILEQWVIFRGKDGRPGCVQNTCAHRACPLHLGSVNEGRIQCPYHGWEYSTDGKCEKMPSTKMLNVRIQSLPCFEQEGMIWIWPGDDPPKATIPSLLPPSGFIVHAEIVMELPVEHVLLLDNLLDLAHAPFTHTSTFAKGLECSKFGEVLNTCIWAPRVLNEDLRLVLG